MKKSGQIIFCLLLYLLIFSVVLGFDFRQLFGTRDVFVFLIGMILLAVPFCDWKKREERTKELFRVCGKRALDAGVIQTFLFLFIRMCEPRAYDGLLPDMAFCFRPMLYAFCAKLILDREDVVCGVSPRNTLTEKTLTIEACMAAGLTRREAEIALLVCKNCSNGEIAEELVISQATVKKHMSNIFEKTGIKKREELKGYISKETELHGR